MAAITARHTPTSRYRPPAPLRQPPPMPPGWMDAFPDFRAPPPLWRFVLLSMLLHALLIALFGAPSGGSREGRAMWGSMQVELRGLLIDRGHSPYAAPRVEAPEREAPPAPARVDRGAAEGAVPLTPPAETEASAVAPSGPAIVEVPTPFPPLLDRLVRPDVRLDEPPPLKVPLPTQGQDLRPPPRERPAPSPLEVPEPLPLTRSARPERVLAEPPPIAAPVLQPVPAPVPAAAPRAPMPVERAAESPALPAAPATQPVEIPPVEVKTIPVPALENIAPARSETAPPVEMAPMPEIRVAPVPPALPERAAPSVPSSPVRPEPELRAPGDVRGPLAPGEARRDGPARRPGGSSGAYDPTAPPLDVDAIRKRAGQMAREGSGQRAVLPFPMPAVPERKSKVETAIENARKPDCKTAYQGLGLAAIVPLIANEFGEGNCRW